MLLFTFKENSICSLQIQNVTKKIFCGINLIFFENYDHFTLHLLLGLSVCLIHLFNCDRDLHFFSCLSAFRCPQDSGIDTSFASGLSTYIMLKNCLIFVFKFYRYIQYTYSSLVHRFYSNCKQ